MNVESIRPDEINEALFLLRQTRDMIKERDKECECLVLEPPQVCRYCPIGIQRFVVMKQFVGYAQSV